MKKSLLALAVAALPAVVSAETTIGGSFNVGLMDTGAPGAKMGVYSLGGGANAINIISTEKVSKDLSTGVRFQMRFKSNTGDANANAGGNANLALFHDASVFLASASMGELRIGKIYEDSNCGLDPWGCATTGGAGLSVPAGSNVKTLVAASTQADSIRYASPRIMGFGLTYQTSVDGKNVAGTATVRDVERRVINLNYLQGPLMAQLLLSKGGPNRVGGSGVNSSEMSIGASYDFKVAKAMLNYVEREDAAGTKTAKTTAIGAVVPFAGQYQLLAGYARDSVLATDNSTWSLGVNYKVGKRTTLGADVFKAAAANAGTGFVLRARHTF